MQSRKSSVVRRLWPCPDCWDAGTLVMAVTAARLRDASALLLRTLLTPVLPGIGGALARGRAP